MGHVGAGFPRPENKRQGKVSVYFFYHQKFYIQGFLNLKFQLTCTYYPKNSLKALINQYFSVIQQAQCSRSISLPAVRM